MTFAAQDFRDIDCMFDEEIQKDQSRIREVLSAVFASANNRCRM